MIVSFYPFLLFIFFFFFLIIRRPPRSTQSRSSAASDVYKRQVLEPQNPRNYIDAGIMMYTMEGLAKELGIPGKWSFVGPKAGDTGYGIAAHIEL